MVRFLCPLAWLLTSEPNSLGPDYQYQHCQAHGPVPLLKDS